ncbi:mitochondrial sodium/calcium exchanger protein [Protopterus annectens]|uniref:mitochondrial sodium/calcium exchanger protein n=1 Tax=Protopterus annectens TaxID=7888 RepID=UPI001CFA0409|nr:mitochondrial sodium/calcium exchanger protein [Protopterus annectens]
MTATGTLSLCFLLTFCTASDASRNAVMVNYPQDLHTVHRGGVFILSEEDLTSRNYSTAQECQAVTSKNASERCTFVTTNDDCQDDSGFLHYLKGAFCFFSPRMLPFAVFLYALWLFYLFLILGVTAEKFFCPNLAAIANVMRLSHNVAGVTFLALGNGAPDVFSAVAAFSAPRSAGLAIGALFGAGVFVTTVVAGGVAMVKPFKAASRPFLRDVIFYMSAVFWTFTILYRGRVTLGESVGYLGLYILYVLTVVLSSWIYRMLRSRGQDLQPDGSESDTSSFSDEGNPPVLNSSIQDPVSDSEYEPLIREPESTFSIFLNSINPIDWKRVRRRTCVCKWFKIIKTPAEFILLLTVPVVDNDKDDRNWKRPLNCLHLITSPLVFILTLKSGKYGVQCIADVFPVWALVMLLGACLAILVFFTTTNEQPPRYHCIFAFIGFLISAMWINAAATEVVSLLRTFGIIFKLSDTILGLTLLAWGNSIGDCFSDITLSRQGYPRMAISACFGGIIFNMLFGIGLGLICQMSLGHTVIELQTDGLLNWILAGALGISLVLSFVLIPLQCFYFHRIYGVFLIIYYVTFLIVAVLTEVGIIYVHHP